MKEEMNRGRLRITLMVLQKKISSNASFEGSLSYRYSVDSGFEDESNVAGLVQQAQCRWDHGVKRNKMMPSTCFTHAIILIRLSCSVNFHNTI